MMKSPLDDEKTKRLRPPFTRIEATAVAERSLQRPSRKVAKNVSATDSPDGSANARDNQNGKIGLFSLAIGIRCALIISMLETAGPPVPNGAAKPNPAHSAGFSTYGLGQSQVV